MLPLSGTPITFRQRHLHEPQKVEQLVCKSVRISIACVCKWGDLLCIVYGHSARVCGRVIRRR
jgi:hypothetical protein